MKGRSPTKDPFTALRRQASLHPPSFPQPDHLFHPPTLRPLPPTTLYPQAGQRVDVTDRSIMTIAFPEKEVTPRGSLAAIGLPRLARLFTFAPTTQPSFNHQPSNPYLPHLFILKHHQLPCLADTNIVIILASSISDLCGRHYDICRASQLSPSFSIFHHNLHPSRRSMVTSNNSPSTIYTIQSTSSIK